MQTALRPSVVELGDIVLSRTGVEGKATGGEYQCQLEGCNGRRVGVRWPDGQLTYPCTKGIYFVRAHWWRIA